MLSRKIFIKILIDLDSYKEILLLHKCYSINELIIASEFL